MLFSFAHIQQMQYDVLYIMYLQKRNREILKIQTNTKVCLSGGKFRTTLCVEPPPQSISDDFDAVDHGKSFEKSSEKSFTGFSLNLA